jgi:hypothetical protein
MARRLDMIDCFVNKTKKLSGRFQKANVLKAPLDFGPFSLLHWIQTSGITLECLMQNRDQSYWSVLATRSELGNCL